MRNRTSSSIPDSLSKRCAIAIIGSGFSGTLVAVHLLRTATQPLTIQLIERSSEFGRGVAYGTRVDAHLLNVPAGKMSAFPDQPTHFLNWLHTAGYTNIEASTFVPRRLYGTYVQSLLEDAISKAPAGVTLNRIADEVVALSSTGSMATLQLCNGTHLTADKVVLALGNFQAALPAPLATCPQRDCLVRDAWEDGATADLDPTDPLLIVGTGLTMVDIVIALQAQGHRGPIYAVSRHGLQPQRHQPYEPYTTRLTLETAPNTTRGLVRWVRNEVEWALAQGYDWRAVIDALRPISQVLWQKLSVAEQRRFLRHVKAYWEVHRHRIAPTVADSLDEAITQGQLVYQGGRIQSCSIEGDYVQVTLRRRHETRPVTLTVRRILNCTGSNCDYRRFQHSLITSLHEQHLIRASALGIGIDTASNGALIQADGSASTVLYTIGTPRKGNLWETTAVPELREQAKALAQDILITLNTVSTATSHPAFTPSLIFYQLFDLQSCTYTYLVADPATGIAALVDPVLECIDRDLQLIKELGLSLRYCLDTHVHADHITAAHTLRQLTGCHIVVSHNSGVVGADRTLSHGDILPLGTVTIQAIATPGHTDHHLAYLVNQTHVLTGDALFVRGCGRTDFQGGDAGMLYDSITQRLFNLPDTTLVYPGHDYQGRTVSTIGEEKHWNPRIAQRSREQFIQLMNSLNLPYPQKMLFAVPTNERCGESLEHAFERVSKTYEAQKPTIKFKPIADLPVYCGMYI